MRGGRGRRWHREVDGTRTKKGEKKGPKGKETWKKQQKDGARRERKEDRWNGNVPILR